MVKRKSYTEEVEKLSKAIDISIEAYKKHPPNGWTQATIKMVISNLEEDKTRRLEAAKEFRTMASLKYDIDSVFTYFQEATGTTVEYFWTKLKEAGLDYKRENKLEKILNRGKIKGNVEYNYVIDMLVVAEQIGLITPTQTAELNKMLGDYKSKKKK